jgi:hypothetical protein
MTSLGAIRGRCAPHEQVVVSKCGGGAGCRQTARDALTTMLDSVAMSRFGCRRASALLAMVAALFVAVSFVRLRAGRLV